MVDSQRRDFLLAVGSSAVLAGCIGTGKSNSRELSDTTGSSPDYPERVDTKGAQTYSSAGLSVALTDNTRHVDSIKDASLVLLSAESTVDADILVSSICSGSVVVIVGQDAGKRLESVLSEGEAERCLPYAVERSGGSIVAGVYKSQAELVTHFYGDVSDMDSNYKYHAVNDIIKYSKRGNT